MPDETFKQMISDVTEIKEVLLGNALKGKLGVLETW